VGLNKKDVNRMQSLKSEADKRELKLSNPYLSGGQVLTADAIGVVGDVIGCVPSPPTVLGGYIASAFGSVVGEGNTYIKWRAGEASNADLVVNSITAVAGFLPGPPGVFFAGVQTVYDLLTGGFK